MGKKSKRRNPQSKNNKTKQKQKGQAHKKSGNNDSKKNDGVAWTVHDDKLAGGGYRDNGEIEEEDVARMSLSDDAPSHPKGSREALRAALERAWTNDAMISDPHGIGSAMGRRFDWLDWSSTLASGPDQLDRFWEEREKDMRMHKSALDRLFREVRCGKCDCADYIMALNCIFHDTFDRLHMDYPPFLNLEWGMMSINLERIKHRETAPLYESHMKIWNGYESRAFRLIKVVQEHYLIPRPEPNHWWLPDPCPLPLKNRGQIPSAACRMEWEREDWGGYDDEEDSMGWIGDLERYYEMKCNGEA